VARVLNFFQTITTHLDFFIVNRVVDLSRTMQAEQAEYELEHVDLLNWVAALKFKPLRIKLSRHKKSPPFDELSISSATYLHFAPL